MKPRHLRQDFTFPKNYEIQVLDSYGLVNPLEQFYQYPAALEEADRTGVYLRVMPEHGNAWIGFFSLGFDSDKVVSALYSCPAPDSFCVIAGGYGYVVKADDPTQWMRVEQRPVTDVRALPEQKLLLLAGFLTITALGPSGLLWTTGRLSWEGISISRIERQTLYGLGWDAFTDKEVPFEVDLASGKHIGGARPRDIG
ncbi:MAG TPA: hypothetical protein VN176_07800 [Verrucomicrobiae bacterium]|jgi:hypothetical protein|nr:hypothetical protein [Verrucomicrobiae bacterium]